MHDIQQNKGNQTLKSGQVIEHDNGNVFLKNNAENDAGRLALDLNLFFKNALSRQGVNSLVSVTFNIPKLGKQKQNI